MDDKGMRATGDELALTLRAQAEAVTNREAQVSAREVAIRERELAISEREEQLHLREEGLSLQGETDEQKLQRERFLAQLRDANERLVLAALRADELAEEARKARELAVERAAIEAEGRRRAEALAQELLATEAVLRVSDSKFRTLANTVPMLVWYANPDGHIAWFNQRWYDYTGMLFHEQVGWRWQSVVAPDDLPRILSAWRAALASGAPLEDTLRLRRNDGEFRWFLSRAHPLLDERGRIVQWFGLMVDIDDQKRAEEQVRADSHAKDEFLATLGHELRNPLAPILAALNLMAVYNPSIFKRERGIIERQVKHLVHLVDDLLDISLPVSSRPHNPISPNSLAGGRAAPVEARKVLVVDDNPDVAEVIAVSLTILGHEVRVAYDGPSALAMIDDFVPDVALLDIGLPMMDGYELAKRLRSLLSPHDIRFVAITGYDDAADRRRSREAGFALHLVKPFDVAALQNGIRGSDSAASPRA